MLKHCVLFLLILCILIPTHAYDKFLNDSRNNTRNCSSTVFIKRRKTHTIVLDTIQDDWNLNSCLSTLSVNYDRIIFTGDYIVDVKAKIKFTYFTFNRPNIVVYTRSLSDSIFRKSVAAVLFRSHWSLVNVVVVNNATFACKDGYFSKEVNSSIYQFLNDFWKIYQMVYVVVEYPDNCPSKFSMYDGNKQPSNKAGQIFERTFITVQENEVDKILMKSDTNLTHDYPLRANIFPRFPTCITDCENLKSFIRYNSNLTNGYCGLDALIMHDVMQVFKFNATFKMQSTTYYGYVQSGRVTGTLGLVVRGAIDISFNSRFMILYSSDIRFNSSENSFNFLYPIWSDSLCAFMKEPNEVPLWHYPYNLYEITTWTFLITSLTFVGFIMYLRRKIFKAKNLQFFVYPGNAVWSGLFGFSYNKKIQRSLLAALCLLCSVVFTAEYQGNVNNMFATLLRYDRLKTLKELCDNGVQVYTYPSIAILLGRGEINNPKTTILQNLKYFPENQSVTEYALNNKNTATIERSDLLLQALHNMTDEDGRPLLYAVNQCFEHYYLSYIVKRGFLFTRKLQVLMMKIVEAGLPAMYNKWTRYTFKVVDSVTTPSSEPRPTVRITMDEQRVAFALLFFGYLTSTAVFSVELWLNMRTKREMDAILHQTYIN